MAEYLYFQEGATYGQADLARYTAVWTGDANGAHLIASAGNFALNSDTDARTVSVGSGRAWVSNGTGGYDAVVVSAATTLEVPQASTLNPRRDLVILEVTSTGAQLRLIVGAPAATPSAPARPARAIALGWVDVPKASTTFSATPTRYTGQYRDQLLSPSPGMFALSWGGDLPDAAPFRVGATVYDLGTNQRWVKRNAGDWYTTDPGPWLKCTLKNVTNGAGTAVTVTGDLYVREDSTKWELSGQLTLSPSSDLDTLVRLAVIPSGISRPTQNTYGASGQSRSSNSAAGVGRVALMTTGEIEYGNDGNIANLYLNEQFSKSPFNT